MGDRICLTFVNGRKKDGVTLYSHWLGRGLIEEAQDFWMRCIHTGKVRDEPSNAMVNFLFYLETQELASLQDGDLYLYPSMKAACSPDDNGYWTMDTSTGRTKQVRGGDFEVHCDDEEE